MTNPISKREVSKRIFTLGCRVEMLQNRLGSDGRYQEAVELLQEAKDKITKAESSIDDGLR